MAKVPLKLEQLIDGAALRSALEQLAAGEDAGAPTTRAAVLQLLKERIGSGRQIAERHADGGWQRHRPARSGFRI